MSITICPDCKCTISDSAITCPRCGYPYQKNKQLYLKARGRMDKAKTSDEILGIAEIFDSIKEFQDSNSLIDICRNMANELPQASDYSRNRNIANNKKSALYAFLITICGAVIIISSFIDGYFTWTFDNSSLSTVRYGDGNLLLLIHGIPVSNLIIFVLIASTVSGILLAWISIIKNKHLEIFCVITSSVTLMIIVICSIIGPIIFTEHNNFGLGFYSYKDFESFSTPFYVQIGFAICFLAVSIIIRIKSIRGEPSNRN